MARVRGAKVKKEVILKNSSSNISHSIKKIKENERKYTIILVSFFFLLFCFIGYFTLRVNNDVVLDYYQLTKPESSIKITGGLVTLTSNHIMSDQTGLQSNVVPLTIENHLADSIHYRIVFVEDDYMIEKCGCREHLFDISSIRYSIDGVHVRTLGKDSNVILEEKLDKNSVKSLYIHVWVDENASISDELHYHGHFKVETI